MGTRAGGRRRHTSRLLGNRSSGRVAHRHTSVTPQSWGTALSPPSTALLGRPRWAFRTSGNRGAQRWRHRGQQATEGGRETVHMSQMATSGHTPDRDARWETRGQRRGDGNGGDRGCVSWGRPRRASLRRWPGAHVWGTAFGAEGTDTAESPKGTDLGRGPSGQRRRWGWSFLGRTIRKHDAAGVPSLQPLGRGQPESGQVRGGGGLALVAAMGVAADGVDQTCRWPDGRGVLEGRGGGPGSLLGG